MAKKVQDVFYWDACIFIESLKASRRITVEQANGIDELTKRVMSDDAQLITSVITLTEVLDAVNDEEFAEKFHMLFDRTNIHLVNVDRSIAMMGRDLRDEFGLETPDSIHVASAICEKATCLYTLDGVNKPQTLGKSKKILPHAGRLLKQPYELTVLEPTEELPSMRFDDTLRG